MTRDKALALLRSGPEGIAKWNEYRRHDEEPGEIYYSYPDDGFGFKSDDFSGLDLRGVNLDRVYLGDATLRGANLQGAMLRDVTMCHADFSEANLRDADLSHSRMQKATFRNAKLDNVRFHNAHLTEADFSHASLRGADLRVLQMSGAKFHEADLTGVRLTGATRRWGSKSVLDLMTATGLEEALFPQLADYVTDVATYVHGGTVRELQHLSAAIERVRFLVRIYKAPPATSRQEAVLRAIIESKLDAKERQAGISEIRELYAVKGELRVPRTLLATTSTLAVSRYELDLVDFTKLVRWINKHSSLPDGALHMHNTQLLLPARTS